VPDRAPWSIGTPRAPRGLRPTRIGRRRTRYGRESSCAQFISAKYGAQAMAVHGGLRIGFATAEDVCLVAMALSHHHARTGFNDLPSSLRVEAECLQHDAASLNTPPCHSSRRVAGEGRAAVMLQAPRTADTLRYHSLAHAAGMIASPRRTTRPSRMRECFQEWGGGRQVQEAFSATSAAAPERAA
jgi:hypothetical protein